MKKQSVVLVTGASSGLGKVTAQLLAREGYLVFGTSRKPLELQVKGVQMLELDVCSDESVNACVRKVLEKAGRINVLINNAGYEHAGALEETSMDEAKEQFETNFFGVIRMCNAVLPSMRRQSSGHIINISSLSGLVGVPFHGFYSASKFALEGYTETLRHEVRSLNIKATLIEPGFMRTNFIQAARQSANKIKAYSPAREKVLSLYKKSVASGINPDQTAMVIQRVVECKKSKLRYRVGNDSKRISRMKALIPQTLFERGTRMHFGL